MGVVTIGEGALPTEAQLAAYARLVVEVGVAVRPGQRLLIDGISGGAALECAPFIRHVAAAAYDAGGSDVVVVYDDQALRRLGFERMADRSLPEPASWWAGYPNEHAQAGDAMLTVDGSDPRLLHGVAATRVAARTAARGARLRVSQDLVMRDAFNWSYACAPTPAWASRVFPDDEPEGATARLWHAVLHACRVNAADPVAAWRSHLAQLTDRAAQLTARRFVALRAEGPGTAIEIGLADGHVWGGGGAVAADGLPFAPNLPTEEVFTAPHRLRVHGRLRGTAPVEIRGEIVEGWTLVFRDGLIVEATATDGQESLERLLATDDGARRLGEVALVAGASPTRETGVCFQNALFEENVACHVAVGAAYPTTIADGRDRSRSELERSGANDSLVHLDLMWGSPEVDVFGVRADGSEDPLLVAGEWAT